MRRRLGLLLRCCFFVVRGRGDERPRLPPRLPPASPRRLDLRLIPIEHTIRQICDGRAVFVSWIVLAALSFTTLPDEPGSAVALVVVIALSIGVDLDWTKMCEARERDHLGTADASDGAGGP